MNKIIFLVCSIYLFSCQSKSKLFEQIGSKDSHVDFNNIILENDSVNVLDFENVYNGGGVGIGDFNGDGLQDIYFTGNLVSNKLYLNQGNFKFADITTTSRTSGDKKWCRGVSVVDINNDGKMDMYVCASVNKDPKLRENILYVNQGNDKDGIPIFRDMAAEYGLNDTTYSTMASFFDYDNDGDLDVYVLVNDILKDDFPNRFRPRYLKGEHSSTGRLYRNDWNSNLMHGVFTNVSREAGILIEGYGHGVTITDINMDGWKDIYVTNDYLSTNILYINNKNGTFTDKVDHYFKHTSANAMGNDVNDINNDGLLDVIELDMNPEDNYRKKMMMNANSYQTYQNSDYFHYQYQYVRNTLQLNQGPRVQGGDSLGDPIFSDIAFFAGIAETDWSWTPLVVDFDDDGFRDLIVTNGFPKDVTDHDFVAFRNQAFAIASKAQLLEQIPEVKIHNYSFRNNGDCTFTNTTNQWGFETPSFSNGAAYGDLDNDGDLDIVINNINDPAMIYENKAMNAKEKPHSISVALNGDTLNRDGIGTWIELYYGDKKQVYEQTPYRGYLSSIQKEAHFGLGQIAVIDSIVIKWPDGRKEVKKKVNATGKITANILDAKERYSWDRPLLAKNVLFTDITNSLGVNYKHEETDYIDFNIQKLLPHKFSEYGPALAVGDIDGNGLDDIISGGSFSNSAIAFLQQPNGQFKNKKLLPDASSHNKRWEDLGMALFDADGDNDLDLYVASGGYENPVNTDSYQDKLYINNGKGDFSIRAEALPKNHTSKSCVRAADFDRDGDLDLFVGGRVVPWQYPRPVSSFILRNDSQNGLAKFTDVTLSVAKMLDSIGLVSDAVWTDFNNDGWQDLIMAGEWMPLTFLQNEKGVFKDITGGSGLSKHTGWWSSIVPGDFDNDGDIDYVAGNLGLNSFYRATPENPVRIYAKDFDNNGSYDAVPSLYLPVSSTNPEKKEFPAQTRDDMVKQIIGFRAKYQNYNSYANSTFDKMFTPDELKGAQVLSANYLKHALIKNLGKGTFEIIALPPVTQYSCLNGMLAEDFDADGNLDLLLNGNDYGTEVSVGRYDACNGLFLKGDGKGAFIPKRIVESGWFMPQNAKALVKWKNKDGKVCLASSQNRGPIKFYAINNDFQTVLAGDHDIAAEIKFRDGKIRRQEISYGSSFLSQSARFINVPKNVTSLRILNDKGETRSIPINN